MSDQIAAGQRDVMRMTQEELTGFREWVASLLAGAGRVIPTIEKIEWETGWGRIETALAGPSDEQLADALFKVFGHKPVCTKLWDEWYQVAADIPWEDRCSPDFREPQPCKGECRIEDARLLQKALEGRA